MRKGFGVKADDLIDILITATRAEVDTRSPELPDSERAQIASQIAIGALRYFMLRYTRNTVIAFDYTDALSFEGETGPYIQYAAVRAGNIFRKAEVTEAAALVALADIEIAPLLAGEGSEGIWELWLTASRLSIVLEQKASTPLSLPTLANTPFSWHSSSITSTIATIFLRRLIPHERTFCSLLPQ